MAKIPTICSLHIRNKKDVTRGIGTGILGPQQAGLFHFKNIGQINHALLLERNNQIAILSKIPDHVLMQLQEPAILPQKEGQISSTVSLDKPIGGKPEWYLSWEQVEAYSKPELLDWFMNFTPEGLTLPKSKNAGETKQLVHSFLSGQFADHVDPSIDETIASE